MNCAALLALLCQMLGVGCNGYKPSNIRREERLRRPLRPFLAVMTGHKLGPAIRPFY